MSEPWNTQPGTQWPQIDPPECDHKYLSGQSALFEVRGGGDGYYCDLCEKIVDVIPDEQ